MLKSKYFDIPARVKSFTLELQRKPSIFLAHAFFLLDIEFVKKKKIRKREKENTLFRKKETYIISF